MEQTLLQMPQIQSAPLCSSSADRDAWLTDSLTNSSKWLDTGDSGRQPALIYNKKTLWIEGRKNSITIQEELSTPGLVAEHATLMETNFDAILHSQLWACSKNKDLSRGKQLHREIKRRGLLERDYSDALITLYAKSGKLQKAHTLLELHNSTSRIPWNALIAGYLREGQGHEALVCYEDMKQQNVAPSSLTYGFILKACAMTGAIDTGKQIHDEILSHGYLDHDIVLGGALVGMYSKCGALSQAQDVLEKLPSRNHICYSALISRYSQNGQERQALHYFEQMRAEGIVPDETTYSCILKTCASMRAIDKGKKIHDEVLRNGMLENHIVVGNALVSMYAKCGAIAQAHDVLEKLTSRNVVSWNALITGYSQNGKGQEALQCFEQMKADGIAPNAVTYGCILKACASVGAVEKGKQIHNEILRQRLLEHNPLLGNTLVNMYAKCGFVSQARDVLENLVSRNVVSWNSLISGYVQNGHGKQALHSFKQMQAEGMAPDAVTYTCILKACASTGDVKKGKHIHDEILRQGFLEHHEALGGALVDMYAKCGDLSQARDVLRKLPSRDVISWSALMTGYVQNGEGQQALSCFEQMQMEGVAPNEVTYSCMLKACASLGDLKKGKMIHDEILAQKLLEHNVVLGGALVDMYAKCGALSQAQDALTKLPYRDVFTWSALIAGYAQSGQGHEALVCFDQMQSEGILPNAVTFASVLMGCALTGAIKKGKQIHDEILRQGLLDHHVVLGGALVDMYTKCGALLKAQDVLEKLPTRDLISWSALIGGYAQEGQVEKAFECFKRMQNEGICPDTVTFLCLLNLCSHLGLVEKGQELFESMEATYFVIPSIECFNCMIDLLGRNGHLGKAVDLIRDMPFTGNAATWNALLSASCKWVNVTVGDWAFQQMLEVDKYDAAAYVLMANIYTAAGMHEKANDVETMRLKNQAWKLPVCSWWADSDERVYEFSMEDINEHVVSKLQGFSVKMLNNGYHSNLKWVLQDMSDALKVQLLCLHAETLALSSALINSPPRDSIYIKGTVRMCGDCHSSISLISKLEKRTIVVFDPTLRHCFKDGKCSCNLI